MKNDWMILPKSKVILKRRNGIMTIKSLMGLLNEKPLEETIFILVQNIKSEDRKNPEMRVKRQAGTR